MKTTPGSCLTFRTLVVSLVLIPLNAYWLIQSELVRYSGHPTCISLFFNVICILVVLTLLNAALRRLSARLAFQTGELLLLYYMLGISSFIAGHDLMQVLIPQLGHAFWFATPENEWHMFHPYLPEWLTIRDSTALAPLYESHTDTYLSEYLGYLRQWAPVVITWALFLSLLVWVMYGLNIILRKQWMEHEKLAYPIAQLPLEIIRDAGSLSFFRRRGVWMGVAIAAGINLMNGLAFLQPSIPSIPVKQSDLGHFFTSEPWNAVGWFPVSFYPFVIGLGFLIPLDLSFSCWAFYLLYKLLLVLGRMTGWARSATALHPNEQMLGAYLGVLGMALWSARWYLAHVLRALLPQTTKTEESTRWRRAVVSIFMGSTLLVLFSVKAGMSLSWAVVFFILYFAIAVAITRLRVELGMLTPNVKTIFRPN